MLRTSLLWRSTVAFTYFKREIRQVPLFTSGGLGLVSSSLGLVILVLVLVFVLRIWSCLRHWNPGLLGRSRLSHTHGCTCVCLCRGLRYSRTAMRSCRRSRHWLWSGQPLLNIRSLSLRLSRCLYLSCVGLSLPPTNHSSGTYVMWCNNNNNNNTTPTCKAP